jgi:UDP-glucose 4-epimerase
MTVLVTGGAGYIGSHACVELLNAGHTVIVADNLVNSSAESLRRVEKITGKTLTFHNVDLTDRAALDALFDRYAFDCVLHFAGLKAVGESVGQPLRYYENNLNSTMNLCESMAAHGVTKILFSSSATVYSPENTMPVKETDRIGGCTNPYGWTKFMCEQILSGVAHAHPDWTVMLLRYFNPVGAHPSGLIGEDPRGIPNNLMPFISQTAAGKRECLSVFGNDYDTPDGTGVRDYLHVVDLARGHVAAMDYMTGRTGVFVFNLGTGHGYSVLDMVRAFEKVTGQKVPYKITPRRPGDVATVFCDPSLAERELGWKAELTLEDMCRDTWNWQSRNPDGYGTAE